MIELINLTPELRAELTRDVEMFMITYKKPQYTRSLSQSLIKTYGKTYENEILTVVTAAAKAVRYGKTKVAFSFSAENYVMDRVFPAHNGKITKKSLPNLTKMIKLVSMMEEDNLLEKYKGFKCLERVSTFENRGCRSILAFSEKLLAQLDTEKCKKYAMAREKSVVEIYDEKGNLVIHKNMKNINIVKTSLNNWNNLLEESEISIAGVVSSVCYKRVFNDNLSGAGRYYVMGTFQTEAAVLRQTIKINGEDTCEWDFGSMFPRMIATQQGITLPESFDPYAINTSFVCDKKELRNLVKVSFMCTLFTKTGSTGAKSAIRSKVTNDRYKTIKDENGKSVKVLKDLEDMYYPSLINYTPKQIADEIYAGIMEINTYLNESMFDANLWKKLQNIDSSIATYVINHFTNKGEVVLCYHDSFVVSSRLSEELQEVMFNAWKEVMGTDLNFKIEEEYDASKVEEVFTKEVVKVVSKFAMLAKAASKVTSINNSSYVYGLSNCPF